MKRLIIIAAVMLMAVSCTKEIDFSGEEGNHYVVVMAQLDPDSNICVNLSYSKFFLDNGPSQHINDADMTLWINGNALSPQQVERGNYHFSVKPNAGDSVWFVAQVPGYGEVSASTKVISVPPVGNAFGHRSNDFAFVHMMDVYDLRVELNDVAGEADYYKFEVYERDQRPAVPEEESEAIDTIYRTSFIYLGSVDRGDTAAPGVDSALFASAMLVGDRYFDGQQKDMVMLAMPIVDTTGLTQRDFWIRVTNYSVEMARYLATASSASSMAAIFSEPSSLYSNVKGGIGVFGSSSKRMLKVKLPVGGINLEHI